MFRFAITHNPVIKVVKENIFSSFILFLQYCFVGSKYLLKMNNRLSYFPSGKTEKLEFLLGKDQQKTFTK